MYDRKLRVFVSSRMQELATERRAIKAALAGLNIDAWIFEDDAGARPQSIQQTYLRELEDADLYLAIFWQGYGDYTIDEFDHARSLKKDCLVYEKHAAISERDSQLDTFLEKIGKVTTGLTSARFHTVEELVGKVKDDVARWQTSLTRQALDQRLDDERERQAGIRAQEHAAPRQRVVNRAPQGIAELFKDRTSQSAAILDTLLAGDSSHRVVTVFGLLRRESGGHGAIWWRAARREPGRFPTGTRTSPRERLAACGGADPVQPGESLSRPEAVRGGAAKRARRPRHHG